MFFYFDYEQQRQKTPLYAVNTAQTATDETSFGVPAGTALPAANGHYPAPATISQAQATAAPTDPVYLQGVANALNVIHTNLGPRARRRDDYEFFPNSTGRSMTKRTSPLFITTTIFSRQEASSPSARKASAGMSCWATTASGIM